jgi:hypothetical protein
MRTSVYTFLLLTALLLTPCAVLAGTDDSGLQVFTVDFSKQLGESADVAQEDTLFSPYCYNMFSSGNGFSSCKDSLGSGKDWTGYGSDIIDLPSDEAGTYAIVRINSNITTTEVYLHTFPASNSGTRTTLINTAYTAPFYEMNAFYGGTLTYLTYGPPSLLTIDGSLTTGSVSLPVAPSHSEVWQNRLFISTSNYLYYSTAQDYTDFTVGPTTGGVIRVWESDSINKLVATQYGLYIFTDNGIFLLSGQNKNAWSLEKISILTTSNYRNVTKYKDTIYFLDSSLYRKTLWAMQGVGLNKISEFPYALTGFDSITWIKVFDDGEKIVLAQQASSRVGLVFDLKSKSWFRTAEFNIVKSDKYFIKNISYTTYEIYSAPQFRKFLNETNAYRSDYLTPVYPWAYQTAWLTLDGNASNRKEIDRIEFDYQGGTTSVYLYYAYGNGSSTSANTTLTAPTNTRLSTYVWNAPIGRQQSNRFYLYFLSSGTQTMTTNYILKQARIYYRNIGNYKTNSLR